jgi:hypothetical protein
LAVRTFPIQENVGKNLRGGQSERDYTVVTRADTEHVVNSLTATLVQSEHAALAAQLLSGDALVHPTCTRTVTADHHPGEEVVVDTYQSTDLQDEARQALKQEATRKLGTRYDLTDTVPVHVLQVKLTTDQKQGLTTKNVRVEGNWIYQFSQNELKQIKQLPRFGPNVSCSTLS